MINRRKKGILDQVDYENKEPPNQKRNLNHKNPSIFASYSFLQYIHNILFLIPQIQSFFIRMSPMVSNKQNKSYFSSIEMISNRINHTGLFNYWLRLFLYILLFGKCTFNNGRINFEILQFANDTHKEAASILLIYYILIHIPDDEDKTSYSVQYASHSIVQLQDGTFPLGNKHVPIHKTLVNINTFSLISSGECINCILLLYTFQ